jgi:hypothetical protein
VVTLISPKSNGYDNLKISVEYHLSKDVDPHSLWLMFYSSADTRSPLKANTIFLGTQGTHTVEIIGTDLLSDGNATIGDYLLDNCVYDCLLTAVDFAGNQGTSGINTNWIYDITPPNIIMSKPCQNGFDNQSIAVEYSLSEQVSTVTMLFIGTTGTVHTVTTTLPGNKGSNGITLGTSSITPSLSDGTFTVKLMACDKAGNDSTIFVVSNWTYDTVITTPTLTLAKGSASTTVREIDVLVENDTDAVKWLIGEEQMATRPNETDSRWTDSEPTSFVLSSNDGKKTVYVWIKDKAGNVNVGRVSKDIILDQNAPTITLCEPRANTSNNGSITVTYLFSEELATDTIRLVFGTISVTATAFTGNKGTNTVSLNVSDIGLTNGATYTLMIIGCDLPGNKGTSNINANWRYDITSPTLGLMPNTPDNQSIAMRYTLSEDVNPSSLKAIFSRGTWTATATNIGTSTSGTWSTTISGNQLGLTDGTYTVTLSATDMAGNTASTTILLWTYDTQIGNITLSIPSGSYTNQAVIAVNIGTITPQESGISYLLSETYSSMPLETNGSWTTTKPENFMLSNDDGYKTIYLWVKDLAGNIISCSATASITLDKTPPTIKLIKPAESSTDNESIEIEYSLSEEVASLTITFDNGTISTTTLSIKAGGTY